MKEGKPVAPITLVLIGVSFFVILIVGTYFLLLESPEDVVRQFFKSKNYSDQIMMLTNDSAQLLKQTVERVAMSFGMKPEPFISTYYDRYLPEFIGINGSERIDDNTYLVTAELVPAKAYLLSLFSLDTVRFVVVKVRNTWKIDIPKSQQYTDF